MCRNETRQISRNSFQDYLPYAPDKRVLRAMLDKETASIDYTDESTFRLQCSPCLNFKIATQASCNFVFNSVTAADFNK